MLRKKLLKISSRLQENYFHMVRPESPVLVVQRQLERVLLLKPWVQKSSRTTGRFRKVGFWCWVNLGLPGTSKHLWLSSCQDSWACPKVGSPLAVCPQNQTHFLRDQEVAQYHAFGIPEGVRNPTSACFLGRSRTQGWFLRMERLERRKFLSPEQWVFKRSLLLFEGKMKGPWTTEFFL